MDNFDLTKYLFEGMLLKENIDMSTILSHDDYKELYIGNKAEHDASPEEEQFSDEYIIDLKPGMYQMIYWNDEGPDYTNFDSKEEYIKDTIASYWGIEHFERKFGEALPTLESVKAAHEAKEDDKKEIKEEEGFVEVSQDEVKMHLKQYRDGMIDGDDLANAIEEIVVGKISAPGVDKVGGVYGDKTIDEAKK